MRSMRSKTDEVEVADDTQTDAETIATEVDDAEDTPAEADDASDDEVSAESGDGPTVDELVADNTKDELLALAEQAGIEVAKSANKSAIAEAIVAGSAGTDEGDA